MNDLRCGNAPPRWPRIGHKCRWPRDAGQATRLQIDSLGAIVVVVDVAAGELQLNRLQPGGAAIAADNVDCTRGSPVPASRAEID